MSVQFTRRQVNHALLAAARALVLPRPDLVLPKGARPLFDFAIAGGWYHGLRDARHRLAPGQHLRLRAEPLNPHDPHAVAVHHGDGTMLGYIPRAANTPVARLLALGARVEAEIVGHLWIRRASEIPDDLVFTGFENGDPCIRLTLAG